MLGVNIQSVSRLAKAIPRAALNLTGSELGRCNVCGNRTVFVCLDRTTRRNHMYCVRCQSFERKRHVTAVLLSRFFPGISSVAAVPASSKLRVLSTYFNDPWRKYAKPAGFQFSGYEPGCELGSPLGDRATCQSVEDLTYGDNAFDMVVTEDVLEHVRDYRRSFEEIRRVLVPGGTHIFTVPFMFDQDTLVRVDSTGPEDVHVILPPEYHGTHLAYRTFGKNLLAELDEIGFTTTVDRSGDCYAFVSRSTK